MARRRRLSPAQEGFLASAGPAPETKSMPLGPAPIAQVAGEAAASAALSELAAEMKRARDEGRLVLTLPVAEIDEDYLVRDRIAADDGELQSLIESLRARGQQTPVEVVALPGGRYGLISGWRRLTALRRLSAETGEPRYGQVKALLRHPETAAEAYVAMVEENEIRVGLSYYERARVAARAVEQGVYDSEKAALLHLYASASRPKRSKIRSFLALYHAADDLLRFPAAIGERLGLEVAKALDSGPHARDRLRAALMRAQAETPEAEQEALRKAAATLHTVGRTSAPETEEPAGHAEPAAPQAAPGPAKAGRPALTMRRVPEGLLLSGPAIDDPEFRARLAEWTGRGG